MMKRTHSRGFTLVELLVAISILAIVSVLAYRGLDGMQKSYARTQEAAGRWRAVALFVDRFAFDVQQPALREVRRGKSVEPAWWAAAGAAAEQGDEVHFTRQALLPDEDDQRIGYRLQQGRVELLVWPALDFDAALMPLVYPLLDKVAVFELRYLGADKQWQSAWAAKDLPQGVSVRLVTQDGIEITRVFALT